MINKVHCIDCKHLKQLGQHSDKECRHQNNILEKIKEENWYSTEIKIKWARKPWQINKNNDCPWFESKWVKEGIGVEK